MVGRSGCTCHPAKSCPSYASVSLILRDTFTSLATLTLFNTLSCCRTIYYRVFILETSRGFWNLIEHFFVVKVTDRGERCLYIDCFFKFIPSGAREPYCRQDLSGHMPMRGSKVVVASHPLRRIRDEPQSRQEKIPTR